MVAHFGERLMSELTETVPFTGMMTNASIGSFTLDPSKYTLHWRSCREYFARDFTEKIDTFFMKHDSKKEQQNIANFVWKIEEILALKVRTKFASTNFDTIICIKPTVFWRSCEMRRSLFTAILRVGRGYDNPEDFEKILFEGKHLKNTNRALMRFMFGFTRYDGPKLDMNPGSSNMIDRGWYWAFSGADDSKVRDYLKWPTDSSAFNSSIQGTLWAA